LLLVCRGLAERWSVMAARSPDGVVVMAARSPDGVVVVATPQASVPYAVVDAVGREVEPVAAYLADLTASDCSPLTIRAYAFDLQGRLRFLLCTCQASGCESVGSCWLSVTAFAAGPGARKNLLADHGDHC